jgi:hypothetical protein
MKKEFNVNIRYASNGFIVRYEEETLECEFVAVSLEETLEIIKDIFIEQEISSGFSNILVNDLKE